MKILFVAMADSVHVARWTRQLLPKRWDLHVYASWTKDEIHPEARDLTVHGCVALLRGKAHRSVRLGFRRMAPTARWLRRLRRWMPQRFDDGKDLARVVRRVQPDIIHSIEMQHGAYLTLEARQRMDRFPPWIVSNVGSDIYYFGRQPEHRSRIQAVLEACDYYTCECQRDVGLAMEYGLRGDVLPVLPVGGGICLDKIERLKQPGPTSMRKWVLLKGYQNWAGQALNGLAAIERCADELVGFRIGIYLASGEVATRAGEVAARTGLAIEVLEACDHDEMLRRHGRARVSIGISRSDAASTSFLEALAMGSFPIQTDTSCADEWIEDGVSGFLVQHDDVDSIADAIRRAVTDDHLVDAAAERNRRTARERLDLALVAEHAIRMYERVISDQPDR